MTVTSGRNLSWGSFRAQELWESPGGHPGLPIPHSHYGLCVGVLGAMCVSTKESRVWDFKQPGTGHFLEIFKVKMGSNVCEYSPNARKVHICMNAYNDTYTHIMIIVKLFIKHKILFGKILFGKTIPNANTRTYRHPHKPLPTHSAFIRWSTVLI